MTIFREIPKTLYIFYGFYNLEFIRGESIQVLTLAYGIKLWTLGGLPVFLPSGQLSGSPCRTQVLAIRDFTITCTCTCTCTCKHALLCNIYAQCMCTCTHVHTHVCTMRPYTSLANLSVCGYTRQPAQWHLSSCCYSHPTVPKGLNSAILFANKGHIHVHVHVE